MSNHFAVLDAQLMNGNIVNKSENIAQLSEIEYQYIGAKILPIIRALAANPDGITTRQICRHIWQQNGKPKEWLLMSLLEEAGIITYSKTTSGVGIWKLRDNYSQIPPPAKFVPSGIKTLNR